MNEEPKRIDTINSVLHKVEDVLNETKLSVGEVNTIVNHICAYNIAHYLMHHPEDNEDVAIDEFLIIFEKHIRKETKRILRILTDDLKEEIESEQNRK